MNSYRFKRGNESWFTTPNPSVFHDVFWTPVDDMWFTVFEMEICAVDVPFN